MNLMVKLLTKVYRCMQELKNKEHISHESTVLWFQTILNRFNSLNTANTGIDTKTGIILAAIVAVLIYASQSNIDFSWLRIIGIIGLVTSLILSLWNIHVKDNSTAVHTTKEQATYYDRNDEEFIWQLIADLEDSLDKVGKINKKKALLYSWTAYLFVGSTALIVTGQYLDVYLMVIGG